MLSLAYLSVPSKVCRQRAVQLLRPEQVMSSYAICSPPLLAVINVCPADVLVRKESRRLVLCGPERKSPKLHPLNFSTVHHPEDHKTAIVASRGEHADLE